MSIQAYINLGIILNTVVLLLAIGRFGVSLYYIIRGWADINELAVGLISVLVILTLIWIYIDPNNPILKTGIAVRVLFILIYLKLLLVAPRPKHGPISK